MKVRSHSGGETELFACAQSTGGAGLLRSVKEGKEYVKSNLYIDSNE